MKRGRVMNNESQKIENALNLALDATEEERRKSLDLNVGYDIETKEWELIIKYSGDVSAIAEMGIAIVPLLNQYAIVTIPEKEINELSLIPEIEYIEKPKSLYFQRRIGKGISGITRVQEGNSQFPQSGKGVLVGILDSGIDYMNREFRTSDGKTRILGLWDQSISGNPPKGYTMGTEYTEEEINQAIIQRTANINVQDSAVPSQDSTGHGTAVAGIAAGENGVAPNAQMVIVKLGVSRINGFPRTIELMEGLDYLVRKALEWGKPMAINISIGNNYGAHDGSSLLEGFVANIANYWKTTICIGSGNEGNTAGHISGTVNSFEVYQVELAIASREQSLNVQLWKYYEDLIELSIIGPSGQVIGPIQTSQGTKRYMIGDTELLLYYGEPTPHSVLQEIYIEWIPQNLYVDSGIWTFQLTPIRIVTGEFSMWLPSSRVLNIGTNFLRPISTMTITVPATAEKIIAVGAYNGRTGTYADFSGRGGLENPRVIKPDIVAPGVGIQTVGINESDVIVSGTSFATPFVTGSAALLMEAGIVDGADPYLYGEVCVLIGQNKYKKTIKQINIKLNV